jgi:signal transduction histidine kinase
VALELSAVAAGLPMAASFAMAGGIAAFRESRRRDSLNQAMHELRRPLQALALSLPAEPRGAVAVDSSLRLAEAAVERLDREINGGGRSLEETQVALGRIVEAAVERWRPPAELEGRSLKVRRSGGEPLLCGDPVGLAQAVDNLISNALKHGAGEVSVEVEGGDGFLRLLVRDRGGSEGSVRGRSRPRSRLDGRSRHGHGLKIVRRVAARHSGSFRLRRSGGCTEARLELPLRRQS